MTHFFLLMLDPAKSPESPDSAQKTIKDTLKTKLLSTRSVAKKMARGSVMNKSSESVSIRDKKRSQSSIAVENNLDAELFILCERKYINVILLPFNYKEW